MERHARPFLIFCAALVAFCGAFFGLKVYNWHMEAQAAVWEETGKIATGQIEAEDILQISCRYDGEEVTFVKEGDTWYYQGDKTISVSQNRIADVLSGLENLVAERRITGEEDWGWYGFDEPSNIIRLKLAEEEITITLGRYDDTTGQYYLMISGDDNVYLVDSGILSAFQKDVEDLTEKA